MAMRSRCGRHGDADVDGDAPDDTAKTDWTCQRRERTAQMIHNAWINLKIYFHIKKTLYENIRGLLCTILCIKNWNKGVKERKGIFSLLHQLGVMDICCEFISPEHLKGWLIEAWLSCTVLNNNSLFRDLDLTSTQSSILSSNAKPITLSGNATAI